MNTDNNYTPSEEDEIKDVTKYRISNYKRFLGRAVLAVIIGVAIGSMAAIFSGCNIQNKSKSIKTDSIETARYYAVVETEEEAIKLAETVNGKLISYFDNVATIEVAVGLEIPYVKNAANEEIVTIESESADSMDDKDVLFIKDDVCYPDFDEDEDIPPILNKKFEPGPFNKMNWENSYLNNYNGSGAVVAIIDTGCRISHEELRDKIIGTYNSVNGTTDVSDVNGHGTHVAGTIAMADNMVGNIGVSDGASLYIIKASSKNEQGKTIFYHSDLVRALNKCVELGNINVINMSLGGGGPDQNFKNAIENCANNGILCVMAAGNEGTDQAHYPSAFGIGLRVAAYSSRTDNNTLAYFSNYGDKNCNIAAPGWQILSCSNMADNKYESLSGTSMASPHVAGVAAITYSLYGLDLPKTRATADAMMNKILSNKNDIIYSVTGKDGKLHTVKGGVDVDAITNAQPVEYPSQPKLKIKIQSGTDQRFVKIKNKEDGVKYYYTTDGSYPFIDTAKELTESKIRLDKKGNYDVCVVGVRNRAYSEESKTKVSVPKGVISEKTLQSIELSGPGKIAAGKTKQIDVIVYNGKDIPYDKFKWTSSNTTIATVDDFGRVTVNKNAYSGSNFNISAKLGDVTNTIIITVK